MTNKKESLVFWADWRRSINQLPKEMRADAYEVIYAYAFDGVEYEGDNFAFRILLGMIKGSIDRQNESYQQMCERNRKNRNRGHESSQVVTSGHESSQVVTSGHESSQVESDNDNDNDNDIDKDKDKDKDKDIETDNEILQTNNLEKEKKSNTNVLPKEKPAKPKTPTFDFYGALIGDGVPEQTANDWLAVRKQKRAANTETAYKGLQREAKKAGMTITEAVQMAAERSWQGFRADWAEREKLERQKAQGLTPNQAYREQVAHDMLHPKTEAGKAYNRMFGLSVLNDNDEEEEFQPYENRYQIENHYPF